MWFTVRHIHTFCVTRLRFKVTMHYDRCLDTETFQTAKVGFYYMQDALHDTCTTHSFSCTEGKTENY